MSDTDLARIDTYVKAYANIGKKISSLEDEIEVLKSQQDTIKAAFLAEAQQRGVTSFKTPFGTASVTTRTRVYSTDMGAFRQWVVANNAADLFEARLHQENAKAWVEANPDNIPPGFASQSTTSITIRANKKG